MRHLLDSHRKGFSAQLIFSASRRVLLSRTKLIQFLSGQYAIRHSTSNRLQLGAGELPDPNIF